MDKVQNIIYHIRMKSELDDCVLRAAETIKEGYTIKYIECYGDINEENVELYINLERNII